MAAAHRPDRLSVQVAAPRSQDRLSAQVAAAHRPDRLSAQVAAPRSQDRLSVQTAAAHNRDRPSAQAATLILPAEAEVHLPAEGNLKEKHPNLKKIRVFFLFDNYLLIWQVKGIAMVAMVFEKHNHLTKPLVMGGMSYIRFLHE